jgi:hypothetical protein
MATRNDENPALELALMRQGLDDLAASSEHCGRCHRTPLLGERIHEFEKWVLCDLCAALEENPPLSSRVIHGPAFGHSIRIRDQRASVR